MLGHYFSNIPYLSELLWSFFIFQDYQGHSLSFRTAKVIPYLSELPMSFLTFQNCQGHFLLFGTAKIIPYLSELPRSFLIFQNCQGHSLSFRTVKVILYLSELPRSFLIFQNCCHSLPFRTLPRSSVPRCLALMRRTRCVTSSFSLRTTWWSRVLTSSRWSRSTSERATPSWSPVQLAIEITTNSQEAAARYIHQPSVIHGRHGGTSSRFSGSSHWPLLLDPLS